MSKRKKIAGTVGLSAVGVLILVIVTGLVIVQTQWFADFVRERIISSVEESTGGKVEIASFAFDPWHLTARIQGFVLHGNEPRDAKPLARIESLEIHLKLFSGIAHTVDLAYVGVEKPEVNVMTF